MNSEELNPERQNAINNSIDSSDRQVIDSFVRRRQETTADLVNTFTYFTMDSVMKAESKNESLIVNPVVVKSEKAEELIIEDLNATDTTTQSEFDTRTDEDGIGEEILSAGTVCGAMTSMARSVHAVVPCLQRKFGNFVVESDSSDEENTLEDEEEEGGYCTSICKSEPDASRHGHATVSRTPYSRNVECLPHTTALSTECDLSALVDEQYVPNEDDDMEDEDFMLNPGEVENFSGHIPSLPDLNQLTCRPIVITQNSSERNNMSEVKDPKEEVCTDEVEPFKLDENFDYDNVKLTPKFTEAELDSLRSFLSNSNLT